MKKKIFFPGGSQISRSFQECGNPVVDAIIKRVLSKETLTNDVISNEEKDKTPTVFINIDYPGEKGEHLLKKYFKKLGRSTNQKVNFAGRYSVTKYRFSQI